MLIKDKFFEIICLIVFSKIFELNTHIILRKYPGIYRRKPLRLYFWLTSTKVIFFLRRILSMNDRIHKLTKIILNDTSSVLNIPIPIPAESKLFTVHSVDFDPSLGEKTNLRIPGAFIFTSVALY